jgi:hypothetical protein
LQVLSYVVVLVILVLGSAGPYAFADSLPKEAQDLIDRHEHDVSVWKEEFDGRMKSSSAKLVGQLKKVRDAYTKPGSLKQAMAIQEFIDKYAMSAQGISPAPISLAGCTNINGQSTLYWVTGSLGGPVWGSDIYTTDSDIGTAAVHAGVLKDGETGAVKITFLPGKPSYESSSRNGVTTESWGPYLQSFTIERAPIKLDNE